MPKSSGPGWADVMDAFSAEANIMPFDHGTAGPGRPRDLIDQREHVSVLCAVVTN